ncbi:BMP family ABC transporter substrate-binding protein [Tissierella sp. MSJ-40]|uniref:BMP family ABC transporter substrate-binding protein n=1 Tax=Tissierella simiarum TaxID=2841534 RepID=A0ABS6E5Q6_9FIRM|nr:BMP family ABC transporter substrate-binding protein [Tissierella simiarum]MBU5437871.1 BMP family ABC transporter substrate-binding protein [Tissierella simiarum]
MKKKLLSLLLITVLVFSLVGCGKKAETPVDTTDEGTEAPETETAEEIKVAMVTDEGGVHDQSFNQSAWEGLQQAEKDLGVKVSYKESQQDADFAPNFESLLDEGNDLIWGIGFKLSDAVMDAATANPEQLYAIVDSSYGDNTPENVVGVMFKAEQPSFLVGYIAGKMTKTDTVGFVGGIAGDIIWGFDYGYQAGVQYAAKELGKEIKVLNQYAESFSDVAKGKAIATQMYQQGADIVFHASGDVGNGVIEAAKEQDKWAIGVDRDQNDLAPDNVLTSAIKRVDLGVYYVTEELKKGDFPGGKTITYGLEDGAVDIAPTSNKHVPEEILKSVEDLKEKIINGEIKVPYNEETYNEYLETIK